ncbi:MAG: tetratricopeptide repeat protein [Alphaproteobacteria bacterium]|nr:tetratricopeptide repeat protein [Alphaproteobacteria bacterium]
MNDNVFREIDEELRRDRLLALWQRYGRLVIVGAVSLVVVVAAKVGWGEYDRRAGLEASLRYYTATELLQQGNEDAARAAFVLIAEDGREGYATLARLHEAALLSAKGDTEGAIRIYNAVAEDGDTPATLRSLARILGAYRRIDREEPATLVSEVEPLTAEDSPWRHSALEITALVAIRSGEKPKAREIYMGLAEDPDTPQALRQRAQDMASALEGES